MNDITKLIVKKRAGDVALVAEMIGETANYTAKLLKRIDAKKHQKAAEALAKVIASRESILN